MRQQKGGPIGGRSVCVIGDAFLDVVVPATGLRAGAAQSRKIALSAGGAANVAVWARRSGIAATFVGRVGNDAAGVLLRDNLGREGVRDLTTTDPSEPTGVCVSLVDEHGERTMVTARGANDHWDRGEMLRMLDRISDCMIIYTDGYSLTLENNSSILATLVEAAKGKGCEVWFNPGSYNVIGAPSRRYIDNFVDVLVLNLEEARELADEHDVKSILATLRRHVRTVVLTMGAEGSAVASGKGVIFTAARSVDGIVDTTGAGDAFAAGFLGGWLSGHDLDECSRLGHELASKVIMQFGAQ